MSSATKTRKTGTLPKVVRVAIYTRKSVTEGLEQEFNTLDAQRESIESYIASQRSHGWTALETRYDDGGFSGANTDRPAFQQLLADVAEGKIDVVAVYKFDRLSRRQIDFLRTMEVFEEAGVGFVSVTQNLDTSTSMGRCMMNVMSAFAQLEREVISERTRDKMLASRRKGMWTGGHPVLGYDVVEKKLVINPDEAVRVCAIFALYLELGSLLAVVDELKVRGWTCKAWRNKAGNLAGGGVLNKVTLSGLLKNPLYIGMVRADEELCEGVHDAIVEKETWDAVSNQLQANAGNQGGGRRKKGNALLAGLVRCGPCGSAMIPHHAKRGARRYQYLVCERAQKEGAKACPGSRVAAGDLERFVLDQIRGLARDPSVLEATITADKQAREDQRPALEAEARKLATDTARLNTERKRLVRTMSKASGASPGVVGRVAELDARIAALAARAETARGELAALDTDGVDVGALRTALDQLDPLWDALFPAEKKRLLDLLIERIDFDGGAGDVSITFRPDGPEALHAGDAR